jgi:hypothetical protein
MQSALAPTSTAWASEPREEDPVGLIGYATRFSPLQLAFKRSSFSQETAEIEPQRSQFLISKLKMPRSRPLPLYP